MHRFKIVYFVVECWRRPDVQRLQQHERQDRPGVNQAVEGNITNSFIQGWGAGAGGFWLLKTGAAREKKPEPETLGKKVRSRSR